MFTFIFIGFLDIVSAFIDLGFLILSIIILILFTDQAEITKAN